MSLGGFKRGCGESRVHGGIYMESGITNSSTNPISKWICDPIIPLDVQKFGLSSVGVKLVEIEGVTHIFDWIGESHYPLATDFIEEAIAKGISRRISKTTDFSKLSNESNIFLVHPKAYFHNLPKTSSTPPCPSGRHEVDRSECSGNLWLMGKELKEESTQSFPFWSPLPIFDPVYAGKRSIADHEYTMSSCPDFKDVQLEPGIIMIAPIERLCIVDPGNANEMKMLYDSVKDSQIHQYVSAR